MRICMFVYNRCTTDARVLKEAATLTAAGHQVQIVAVLDATTVPRETLADGTTIVRIDRRPLHYRLVWGMRRARTTVRRPLGIARRTARRILDPTGRRDAARARDAGADEDARPPRARRASVVRGTLYRAHKPLMYLDWYLRAHRLVRADRFDVLHAHDLNTLPVVVALKRTTGTPVVYDAHELYPEIGTLSAREARVWRTLEPPLIRRADATATVCDSIAQVLATRYRVPRPLVLLNCPEAQPPVDPASSPLRAAAGLPADGESIVLYQGGFAANRGLPQLVEAMTRLEHGVLVLMGWGPLEDELARLARRAGLGDRVRILPPVARHELLRYTAGADVGAIPYQPIGLNNTYSTPNKLFEYIAAGLPVVGTRLPELERVIDGRGIGATFATVDPDAIAQAIRGVLDDPAHHAALRTRTLAIRDEYTWERQAGGLLGLYDGLPARRPR